MDCVPAVPQMNKAYTTPAKESSVKRNISFFLVCSMIVGGAPVRASSQNPLSDWVRSNKRDYRVRSSPNSFPLLGYVYVDRELSPPPLARGADCLSEALLKKIETRSPDIVAKAENKILNSQVKASDVEAFLRIAGKELKQDEKAALTASFKGRRVRTIELKTGNVTEYILTSVDLEGASAGCMARLKADGNAVVVAQALAIDGAEYAFKDEKGTEISVDAEFGQLLAKFGLGSSGSVTQSVTYDRPIFFGYVQAKFCKKRGDFRQKC